jgi:hypothetical protein
MLAAKHLRIILVRIAEMPRLDRAPVKCIVYKMDEQLKAGIVTDKFHQHLNIVDF